MFFTLKYFNVIIKTVLVDKFTKMSFLIMWPKNIFSA